MKLNRFLYPNPLGFHEAGLGKIADALGTGLPDFVNIFP